MRKWNYVSKLVDVRKFKKEELNLIVSGTGTGKSYWALEKLIEDLHTNGIEVKPSEIYFITSRRLTADQQAEGYVNAAKLSKGHTFNALDFIEEYNEIPVMTYKQFEMLIENDEVVAKYIIFDEIHAVIIDSSYQTCMKTIKDYIMLDKETVKIAMTATDFVVTKENFFIKINKLIEEVNNRFEVTDELIFTYQRNLHLLLNGSKNKSLVMVNTILQAKTLQEKLTKTSKILCSKYSQHFNDDMLETYEYIKKNKAIPDDVDVLICTTCGREGFEIKHSTVENVAVYGADAINIIQFLGRYRGNTKNLILVNDFFRATGKANIDDLLVEMSKEYYDMYSLVSRSLTNVSNYYSKYLRYSLNKDIKISRFSSDESFMLFLQWFNENWTERLIYTKEHKKEIADKALEFGLRKEDRKKHTFQSLIKMVEEKSNELLFLSNGKLMRKNSDIIESYRNLDVIESDRISPYIVVNADKYGLHSEDTRLSEDEINNRFLKWFDENYTNKVVYKKEDKENITETCASFGVRDENGDKLELMDIIEWLEMISGHNEKFVYLADNKILKNGRIEHIERDNESDIVNEHGQTIEISKEVYDGIMKNGKTAIYVDSENLEFIYN